MTVYHMQMYVSVSVSPTVPFCLIGALVNSSADCRPETRFDVFFVYCFFFPLP